MGGPVVLPPRDIPEEVGNRRIKRNCYEHPVPIQPDCVGLHEVDGDAASDSEAWCGLVTGDRPEEKERS